MKYIVNGYMSTETCVQNVLTEKSAWIIFNGLGSVTSDIVIKSGKESR